MKRLGLFAVLALSLAQWSFSQDAMQLGTPYVTDPLSSASQSAQIWHINGNVASEDDNGLTVTDAAGASFISSVAVPDGSSQYQVSFQMSFVSGPTYVLYLEATPNALLNMTGTSTGSFYAFTLQGYTAQSGGCAVQATLYKVVNGSVTQIASASTMCSAWYTAIAAPDGTIRLAGAFAPPTGAPWIPGVSTWNEPLVWKDTGTPLTGQAGFGAAGSTSGEASVQQASISPIDRTPPSTIPLSETKTYVTATEVDIQTGGAVDDAQGVGLYEYLWYRDNQFIAATFTPEYSDKTVAAGSTHVYGVGATDYDGNVAPLTSFSVTTPSSAAVSPRQIGIRSTGSYWGAMGEQIDARSGNLNYAYPLVTTLGRGSSLPLGITYNSQNWRLDSNNNSWNLGADTGYGYGWQLQFGSITPYFSSTWNVAFYEFRDAGGAIYRLDQNNNGLWTSKDSIYVTYDAEQDVLYFNDGSTWTFFNVSDGLEPDAGTLYPSMIEDSNGNVTWVDYENGIGGADGGGSARIKDIYDSRSSATFTAWPSINFGPSGQPTYSFTYDSSGYLASITNNVGSGEAFTFSYNTAVTLTSPFSSTAFGSVRTLAALTNATTGLTTSFSYDPSNDGELTQVTMPYGGYIRWQYSPIAYAQGTLRGVSNRFLFWDSSIGERSYTIARTLSGDSTVTANAVIVDNHANAGKNWIFDTALDATQGLVTSYQQYRVSDGLILRQLNYTWAQDPAGRNYIGRTQDIADPGQSYSATKQTDQVLDQYGNVTQTKVYAFGNLTTPAKTYTNTYLSGSAYSSRYIFNRLLKSTVTDNANHTLTLTTNNYDQGTVADASGAPMHDSNYGTPFGYRGNLTSSTSFTQVTNQHYDITGAVIYTDDGNTNHGLTITNSSAANYAAPSAITTANSLTTSFSWSTTFAPLNTTGPNGETTSTAYDSVTNRPTSTTSPYGATTTYSYSTAAPQVVATTNGHWTQTYFDGLGRTSRVAEGNGGTTVSYTDTVYDTCGCTPLGKPYSVSLPYASGATPVWKSNSYDALGRTTASVAPDGSSTTTYGYAGNTVTITDPTGEWKKYTYDAFGQLVQVTEQSPNTGTEPDHVAAYTYDVLGHLIQVSMTRTIAGQLKTQTRTWVYDSSTQRLTSITLPESGVTSYTYNSDGTLATLTDAKSQRRAYSYDAYGRIIQIARGTLVNGTFTEDTTQRTTFSYDGSNAGFSSNTTGRISQITYSGPHGLQFAELYSYHAAGAVTAKRMSVSGAALGSNTANFDAGYTYDALGNLSTVQYPFAQWSNGVVSTAGPQYSYSYDAMNRINGMTGPGNQTLVSSVTYGPANQMLQLNASSFTETRAYNNNLQLTELVSGAVHLKYSYSATQNNGHINSMQDVVSGETVTYTYDSLNRLIQASGTGDPSGAWAEQFTYDGFGNLTYKAGSRAPTNAFLTTNPLTNRLSSGGAGYDNNGNLTAYGTGAFAVSYAYDIENRMSVAVAAGSATETLFGYDSSNQRVYQGTYNTGSGLYSNEQLYFYGADRKKLVAFSLQTSGGNISIAAIQTKVWFAGRLLTPQDRIQSQGKYFPYGEDRYSPVPPNPANDQEKFASYTRDSSTGLDYAYKRYYDANVGRFHTADSYTASADSGTPQSWNRFGYVQNDPIDNNDPSGAYMLGDPWDSDPWNCYGGYDSFAPVYGGGYGGLCMYNPYYPGYPVTYGGGGSPQRPTPPPPQCFAQLKDRPVNDPRAELVGSLHTFWWVKDRTGTNYIISGGPVTVGRTTYLQEWATAGNSNGTDSSSATLVWSSGLSSALCDAVDKMLSAARSFPGNSVYYVPFPGPNSNSGAHYIANAGGLSPSGIPLTAYGWNTGILISRPAPPPAPRPGQPSRPGTL